GHRERRRRSAAGEDVARVDEPDAPRHSRASAFEPADLCAEFGVWPFWPGAGRGERHLHVGEDRSGAGTEGSLRALKPPPDRLYGRARGHRLRPRQERLLELTLPRLAFAPEQAADPLAAFPCRPARLWLEIGFGGGEHALAKIAANPDAGMIACEVFDNG